MRATIGVAARFGQPLYCSPQGAGSTGLLANRVERISFLQKAAIGVRELLKYGGLTTRF